MGTNYDDVDVAQAAVKVRWNSPAYNNFWIFQTPPEILDQGTSQRFTEDQVGMLHLPRTVQVPW